MAERYEKTGIIAEIGEVQTFNSGFSKRSVILDKDIGDPSKYPNPLKFTFKKDKCDLLDGLSVGQRVKISFTVDGRKWDGPKGTQYFVDLTGFKVEVLKADGSSAENCPPPAVPELGATMYDAVQDDMPF